MADGGEEVQPLNLQQALSNAAEEMADILSAFGRFSKTGRKNDSTDNDFVSAMLGTRLMRSWRRSFVRWQNCVM
jgi:type III secretion protein W